ncbi:MAG TPA: hypothetical protein VNA17_08480 [Pyrinomonadaceae bacterium]|nr:hypothetical protein [Pyrinomonadaceae bacterium]
MDSTWAAIRQHAGKYGLASAVLTAGLLVYVRTEFRFERGTEAGLLLLIITVGLLVSLALGLIGLPRLESFFALFVFTITAIFFVAFWPHYMLQ